MAHWIPLPEPRQFDLLISEGVKIYDLKDVLPPEAKEVLLYFFVSVRDKILPGPVQRAFYEISTFGPAYEFTKYMNCIFTKNDYVMNSENIWMPTGGGHQLKIKSNKIPWPQTAVPTLNNPKSLKQLRESQMSEDKNIYAEFFVVGYRI